MLPALVSLKPREDLASMYLEEKASLWKIADKKKKKNERVPWGTCKKAAGVEAIKWKKDVYVKQYI